ncbi:MAG: DoxX family protein [Desulfobacteraceae bacterium]|nr:DoxX family protein [Desulfobacteraceae bacterium]
MRILNWVYRLLRWALGIIFICSGSIKLADPGIFAVLIDAYGIVPEMLLLPVAVILPLLEVAAGIGMLFDVRGSLWTIAGLLLTFMIILGYGLHMGIDVDCGCFGSQDPEAAAFHGLKAALYRDLGMFAAVVFLVGWRKYSGIRPIKFPRIFTIRKYKRRVKDAFV